MTAMSATPAPAPDRPDRGRGRRPCPGETVAGDAHPVAAFPHGAPIAALDGLGHGEDAALAARAGVAVLREHPAGPLAPLMRSCHEALRRTRGIAALHPAAASLARLGIGHPVLATDGIASALATDPPPHRPVQAIAEDILARCARASDDALVPVARYRGRRP